MQRIIVDTNLLVSALIGKSFPHLVINLIFIDDHIQLCISDEVLREYDKVLNRAKFSKYPNFKADADQYLNDINKYGILFTPTIRLKILTDADDNKFLELAAICNANFLITGNMKHFPMSSFGNTRMVTPKEYWEKYR